MKFDVEVLIERIIDQFKGMNIERCSEDGTIRYYFDKANNLFFEMSDFFEVSDNEIMVVYHKEHEHFYGFNYKSVEEMANAVVEFLHDIIENIILFEYYYINKKLVRYDVFIVDDK